MIDGDVSYAALSAVEVRKATSGLPTAGRRATGKRRMNRRRAVQAGKERNRRETGSKCGCFVLTVQPVTATSLPVRPGAQRKWKSGRRMDEQDGTRRLRCQPARTSRLVAEDAVDGVFEAVGETTARREDERFVRFGTFGIRRRPTRTARNPRTGESLESAVSTTPKSQPGKSLRGSVNGGIGS